MPDDEPVGNFRLHQLLRLLRDREGFCNYAMMTSEVRSMAAELLRHRDIDQPENSWRIVIKGG